MAKQFANTITSFLIRENIINDDDVEIYRYGTEQILINLTTFIIIGILATIMDAWIETVFFFVGMILIRIIAGGYHAKTPQRCNVITFSVYAVNMVLINLVESYVTYPLIYTMCMTILLIIFFFAPVDHKNRVLKDMELIKARNRSRLIGLILVGVCIGLSFLFGPNNIISLSTMMSALTAYVSLFIGSIVRGGERNEEAKFFT